MTDTRFMGLALAQARRALAQGEVPVGAVLVRAGQVISVGTNACIAHHDPTAHAEIVAMRAAGQALENYRLDDCELFVTLEPCAMCAGAMLHARLKRVVFGAEDPKTGAAGSVLNLFNNPQINHQTQVQGRVMAEECTALLQSFFKEKRESNKAVAAPLREDALRTPQHRFAVLDMPPWTSHYLCDLPSLSGLRLHYWDESSADAACTSLCLHDFESWGFVFKDRLPALLTAGSRVVVPDLIGFGQSDKPKKESVHTLAWHVQILLELLEHLAPVKLILHHTPGAKALAQALFESLNGQYNCVQLLELQMINVLPEPWRAAPFPDRGHQAGPRAMAAFKAKK
jgi:tRNA(adenine34) deaminase